MKNTIHVTIDENIRKVTAALLKDIYLYYPIGLPFLHENFNGIKTIRNKIETKINNLISSTLPDNCVNLKADINSTFKNFEIIDNLHRQFPNYAFDIKFVDKTSNSVQVSSYLKVKLSLLTDHFTIYFEHNYRFLEHEIALNLPLTLKVLSSVNTKFEPYQDVFSEVKEIVYKCFPHYEFVPHKILFSNTIIGGVPYGVDNVDKRSFPLYFYLFDSDLVYEDYKIIL